MKSIFKNISFLSEDINQIINETKGDKFDMLRLCRDHTNPAVLKDDKPVLDILQDDLVGIFDLKSNHYFIDSKQACRLAIFYKLPIFGMVAIMLKSDWEMYLADVSGFPGKGISNLSKALKDSNLVDKYSSKFSPDKGKIISHIASWQDEIEGSIYLEQIEYVILELLTESTFLSPNKTICSRYSGQLGNEKLLLVNCTEKETREYYRLKELWKYKTSELSDLLFLLERQKRVYINLENKYLKYFGHQEFKKMQLINNSEKYTAVLKLMKKNPWLTYRELIASVNKKMQQINRRKQILQSKINRSNSLLDLSFTADTHSIVTAEFKKSYADQCKTLLKKLYFLLHSDTCPGYSELNENKKHQINKLWLQLLDTTQNEFISYSPTMLLYQYPDIDVLEEIYLKACTILGITPNYVEAGDHLEFMITKGTSYKQIIEFLTVETEKIETHLAHIELVQDEYTHNSDSQYYRFALDNVNNHKEKLKEEINELKQKVSGLKKKISDNLIKENV